MNINNIKPQIFFV